MRTFKRIVALLMVMALLASLPVATAAESQGAIFDETVSHSITVEEDTGWGLAFRIRMHIKGAAINEHNEFVNTNATAVVNGEEYAVVKMGAIMANTADNIALIDYLTLENVNDARTVLDVPARYLCADPEADSCVFAVRITNLPPLALGCGIACRPYIVLKDTEGNESTLYGGGDIATYNQIYYSLNAEETPVWAPSIANVDDRIAVSNVSAAYVGYAPAIYGEAFEVSLTLENVSADANTSADATIAYICKDAEGNVLSTQAVAVGALAAGDTTSVKFYAPMGTATIETGEKNLHYVPAIVLPAIGTDIDVVKQKNRIRVYATAASFNEDGTIHVALTFRNYTSNWITEETDYIQYTYYNAAGKKIKTETLYIGVIDTKKYPIKTYTFDLPANAASVKITNSKITYWTEWS